MKRELKLVVSVWTLLFLAAPATADDVRALTKLIDRQVQLQLDTLEIQRVPQSDDAEFLRRVYLDLHGVVPPATGAAAFLDSKDPDKRTKLIDELLADPQFGEHFADLWQRRLLSPTVSEQR